MSNPEKKRARKTRAVAKTLILVLMVGPFLTSAYSGSSCGSWFRRDINVPTIHVDEIHTAAAQVRVLTVPALPAGASGAALPGITILTSSDDLSLGILMHEAVHHIQMKREGRVRYHTMYAADYVRGLYSGCGAWDAYRSVRYEIQAYSMQNRIPQDVREMLRHKEDPREAAVYLAGLYESGTIDKARANAAVRLQAASDAGAAHEYNRFLEAAGRNHETIGTGKPG